MEARLEALTQGVVRERGRRHGRPLHLAGLAGLSLIAAGSLLALNHDTAVGVTSLSPSEAARSAGQGLDPVELEKSPYLDLKKVTPMDPRCERALEVVARAGLQLEVTTAVRCPGNTESRPGDRQHSGVACWDHQWYCPDSSYIAINPDFIRDRDDRMQHVIAHEICHIQHYRLDGTPGTEAAADACAAAAGFPR